MLHAIKPMIWQALQTLREPNDTQDCVKRSKLQVLSHNLSADGNLPQLVQSFKSYFGEDEDKIDSKKYLDTLINDAADSLLADGMEKEMKICVERVHHVCWELCKVQVTAANGGKYPNQLTESSTKIWWKIFNTFSERDNDTGKMYYPVVMDWEEVDYWANVLLKVMALPTIQPQRQERKVMGSTALRFQEALQRFNARINEKNSMYVRDSVGNPDVVYIEQALGELNVRLFEGIYLNGALSKVKKGHTSPKWCVLYQLGLGFADSPSEVDKSNHKSFIPIGSDTEIQHLSDKSGRPVRFQLKNPKESTPIVFEANNISTRNKWMTAIICMKHGTAPNYEKDSIARRNNRIKNRRYEAELKEALQEQKEQTQNQMEGLKSLMQMEQQRFQAESEQLRSASREELQQKVSDYEGKLQSLMKQMHDVSESHEQEKQAIGQQHEEAQEELRRRLDNQLGNVQSKLQAEISDKSSQIHETMHENEQLKQQVQDLQQKLQQSEEKLAELEERIRELLQLQEQAGEAQRQQLAERKQIEEQMQQLDNSRNAELLAKDSEIQLLTAQQTEQQQQLQDKQQQLEQLQQQMQQQQEAKQQWEKESAQLPELRHQLEETTLSKQQLQQELNAKDATIQEKQKELSNAVAANNSLQKKYDDLKTGGAQLGHHRGPGFNAQFKS